jgi:quercetin dioxygenase-like cupin family protein
MPYIELSGLGEREIVPGFIGKFIHTDRMTVSLWKVTSGTRLPLHSHPHEQVTVVVRGRLEMNLAGSVKVLEPGIVASIPPDAEHSGCALCDCDVIDVFSPVREDYRVKRWETAR